MPCYLDWLGSAALSGFGDPVKHLADVVRYPPDPEALGDALYWVHQSGRDEDAFAAIQPLLSDQDSRVRMEATSALCFSRR